MIKKKYHLLIICLSVALLTGCWDNVPIEENGFIAGSAIDVKNGKVNGNYHLLLTNQFVTTQAITTSGEEGAGEQEAYMNVAAGGDSLFKISDKMAVKISDPPFYGHLKVIIVSKELAATPHLFANMLDLFLSGKQMRRDLKVIVADGEANKMLDVLPENEEVPAIYIDNLLSESLKQTSVFDPIVIGEIQERLLANESFVLPEVRQNDGEVEYEGASVFHGMKSQMVGSMNTQEVTGLSMVTGGDQGGSIELKYRDHLITFRIYNEQGTIDIDTTNPEKLAINMQIKLEGGIAEIFGNENLRDPQEITWIEKQVGKEAEKYAKQAISKSKDLNADIFGIGDQLKKKHYDTWQKIKKDWEAGENYFQKSDIDVQANAKIRTSGAIERVEGEERKR